MRKFWKKFTFEMRTEIDDCVSNKNIKWHSVLNWNRLCWDCSPCEPNNLIILFWSETLGKGTKNTDLMVLLFTKWLLLRHWIIDTKLQQWELQNHDRTSSLQVTPMTMTGSTSVSQSTEIDQNWKSLQYYSIQVTESHL